MSDRRLRWLIIALAIVVRIAAVLVLQSHTVPRSTYEHGEIAANLLAGRGFSVKFLGGDGPTSQQAPIYPFVLAAVYAVGGVETPRSLLILELGQGFLGGWLAAEAMALASAVYPGRRRIALFAGLIAALHPTLVYAATHVQVALLAATLLTATLARAFRAGETRRTRDAAHAGVYLGLLLLTDPILGLVAPAALWATAMGAGWKRTARLSMATLAVACLCVSPWIVRNAYVHGELVIVKSSFGYAFWQGNCSLSEGTDKVVRASAQRQLERPASSLRTLNAQIWAARHEAGYLDDIALTKADYNELARVSEPERSRILFRRALSDLRADPSRYPQLCLRRLRYFFLFDPTNPKTSNAIYRVSHLGLTFLAVCGLLLGRSVGGKRVGPLLITVGLVSLFHTLTIVSARFHIPIEPLFVVLGAGVLARVAISTPAADDVVRIGVISRLRSHVDGAVGA